MLSPHFIEVVETFPEGSKSSFNLCRISEMEVFARILNVPEAAELCSC